MVSVGNTAAAAAAAAAVVVVAMVAGAISELWYKWLISYIYGLDEGAMMLDILTIPQCLLGRGSIYSRRYMTIAIVPSATVFHRL